MTNIISHTFNNATVTQRADDNYINLTEACKANGKRDNGRLRGSGRGIGWGEVTGGLGGVGGFGGFGWFIRHGCVSICGSFLLAKKGLQGEFLAQETHHSFVSVGFFAEKCKMRSLTFNDVWCKLAVEIENLITEQAASARSTVVFPHFMSRVDMRMSKAKAQRRIDTTCSVVFNSGRGVRLKTVSPRSEPTLKQGARP
jgi:hypothetical protein